MKVLEGLEQRSELLKSDRKSAGWPEEDQILSGQGVGYWLTSTEEKLKLKFN